MTETKDDGVMNQFDTGATRDTSEGKLLYDKFLCPNVLKQFAKYMNMNRLQSNGELRDGDNWQKGIPMEKYLESGYRHFFEWWAMHRKDPINREMQIELMAGLCGLVFNAMGYMHEWLKRHPEVDFDGGEPTEEMRERQLRVEYYRNESDQYDKAVETYPCEDTKQESRVEPGLLLVGNHDHVLDAVRHVITELGGPGMVEGIKLTGKPECYGKVICNEHDCWDSNCPAVNEEGFCKCTQCDYEAACEKEACSRSKVSTQPLVKSEPHIMLLPMLPPGTSVDTEEDLNSPLCDPVEYEEEKDCNCTVCSGVTNDDYSATKEPEA